MSLPSIISLSKLLLGALAIQGGVQKPQAHLHNVTFEHVTLQDNIPSEDIQFPGAYQFLESDFDMQEDMSHHELVGGNHLVPAHIYPNFSYHLKPVENKNNRSTSNRKKAKRKYIKAN